MAGDDIPEPWLSFLRELDNLLAADSRFGDQHVDLHCFGGVVMMLRYDLLRSTNDIDVMAVRPYPVGRAAQKVIHSPLRK